MSALAWANASWRNLLSKLETSAKENTSLRELSLISPLCSHILTLGSDSSIWWQSSCQWLISMNRSQTQGLPRTCCRIDHTHFISIWWWWLGSLTNFCWGNSGLHWNPVPAWGCSPAQGLSISWFNRTGLWISWRWISLGGSPSPAAPH